MDLWLQISFATLTFISTKKMLSLYEDTSLVDKVMKSFQGSGLLCAYGIATSLMNSGEQWLVPILKSPWFDLYVRINFRLIKKWRGTESGWGQRFCLRRYLIYQIYAFSLSQHVFHTTMEPIYCEGEDAYIWWMR